MAALYLHYPPRGPGPGLRGVRVSKGTINETRTRTPMYPADKPGRVSIPVTITSKRRLDITGLSSVLAPDGVGLPKFGSEPRFEPELSRTGPKVRSKVRVKGRTEP